MPRALNVGNSSRCRASHASATVEMRMQVSDGNIPDRLSEDGSAGAGVELGMVWNGEYLSLSTRQDSNELYMAAFV